MVLSDSKVELMGCWVGSVGIWVAVCAHVCHGVEDGWGIFSVGNWAYWYWNGGFLVFTSGSLWCCWLFFWGEYDVVVKGIEGTRYSWRDAFRHSWCMLEGRWLVCCSPSTHVVYHISHTSGGRPQKFEEWPKACQLKHCLMGREFWNFSHLIMQWHNLRSCSLYVSQFLVGMLSQILGTYLLLCGWAYLFWWVESLSLFECRMRLILLERPLLGRLVTLSVYHIARAVQLHKNVLNTCTMIHG